MKKFIVCVFALCATISVANAQAKKTASKEGKPVMMKNLLDSFSYAAGVNIATNMKSQGISSLNTTLMLKAIDDIFKNNPTALSPEQCNSTLQEQMGIFGKLKEAENKKLVDAEKAKCAAFLANNKTRKEVTTLPNGLQYEVLEPGDPAGVKPTSLDTVVVDYIGTLIDVKTPFDQSVGRGPATFSLKDVIAGWTEVIQLMTKGAHWKVYIPSDLAYGDTGRGAAIPGGATLVFEITLHDIKPATLK